MSKGKPSNPSSAVDPRLKHIRWLSRWLDSSIQIPGTNLRIGFDALIGLIPGIGDALGAALSSYIIILALSLNISAWTLTRMVINVLIEAIIGAIPILGDVFDAVWKANEKNRRLVEESLASGRREKLDRWYIIFVLVSLAGSICFAIWAAVTTLSWIFVSLRSA